MKEEEQQIEEQSVLQAGGAVQIEGPVALSRNQYTGMEETWQIERPESASSRMVCGKLL